MQRYIIGSVWDRAGRNGINSNFEYLFEGDKRIQRLISDFEAEYGDAYDEFIEFLEGFDGTQLIEQSYNLFNKDITVSGRLDTDNGEIIDTDSTWRTTGFIPVEPGRRLQIKPNQGATVLYDANYNYIQQVYPEDHPAILPSNARFVRNTMGSSSVEGKYIYLGDEDLPYVEYGYSYTTEFHDLIRQIASEVVPTPETEVKEYINLFNPDTVSNLLLDGNTGEANPTEGTWRVSDYIPVMPGKLLQIHPNQGVTVMYDENYNYINQIGPNSHPFRLPSNARYIRNNMAQSSVGGKYIYLGENMMPYYPYMQGPGTDAETDIEIKEYVNLFNKDAVTNRLLNGDTGEAQETDGGWLVSEYIPVLPNHRLQIHPNQGVTVIYDSNYEYIRQIYPDEHPYMLPSNARYIRNNMGSTSADGKYIYLGENQMPYYPYMQGPGAIDDNDDSRPLKVLIIGNSYSVDTFTHLHDICLSAGANVVVGVAHDSGGSLSDAMSKISNEDTIHSYYKWTNQNGYTQTASPLYDLAITDEDWDIILFQQMSFASRDYSTFQPHLSNLKSHVEGIATNPNVRFGINMIWERSTTSSSVGDKETQVDFYNDIVSNYRRAMLDSDLEILIPTGTAIQNGRENEHLIQVGYELTRDGAHLDEGIGRYIAAMTVFETLFNKNTFGDVSFAPGNADKHLVYLAKMVAKKAVDNPYKISEL